MTFKGVAAENIQSPLSRALAIIFNASAGKEQALAYVGHYVLSEARFFSKNPRRLKLLAGRLLRKLAASGTPLAAVGERLRKRLSPSQFTSIKQDLYSLSQSFGKPTSDFARPDASSRKTDRRGKAENTSTENGVSSPHSALNLSQVQDSKKVNAAELKKVTKSTSVPVSGVNAPSVSAPEVPLNAQAALPVNVPPPPPLPKGMPIMPPPPPPPPLFSANKAKVPLNKPGTAAANKIPKAPKTRAERFKTPWNANKGEVKSANDIIVFNDATKKIEGEPKISADKIATVSPAIIAQLNLAQWTAMNAYYFACLTDEQQKAIDPIVLKDLCKSLPENKVFAIAKDSKAKELELKLACLKNANVIKVLEKVPQEDVNYGYVQILVHQKLQAGGVFDKNRASVVKALDYQPAAGETVEQITVPMLDHFYGKAEEKPAVSARKFKSAPHPLEVLLTEAQKNLRFTNQTAYNRLFIELMQTERGKAIMAAARAERLAKQQAEKTLKNEENSNAEPFGNRVGRNPNAHARRGEGSQSAADQRSEWQQKLAAMAKRKAEAEALAKQQAEELPSNTEEASERPGMPAEEHSHFNRNTEESDSSAYGREYGEEDGSYGYEYGDNDYSEASKTNASNFAYGREYANASFETYSSSKNVKAEADPALSQSSKPVQQSHVDSQKTYTGEIPLNQKLIFSAANKFGSGIPSSASVADDEFDDDEWNEESEYDQNELKAELEQARKEAEEKKQKEAEEAQKRKAQEEKYKAYLEKQKLEAKAAGNAPQQDDDWRKVIDERRHAYED